MHRVSIGLMFATAMLVASAGIMMAQDTPPPRGGDRRDGPGQGNFRLPPLAIMEAIDADKDGKLSAAEIKTADESLRKLDKNTDGKLSADEIGWPPQFGGFGRGGGGGRGGRGGPPGGRGGEQASRGLAERIMKRDSNADGKISKDELPRSMNRLFARTDRNGDERIDESEAKQLAEELGLTAQPAPPANAARP